MDFLNKAFAQFNELFRSMTPGGRITAGLLLVVAVASVGYLFQSQVTGGDDYLFEGNAIDAPTLNKMEEAFGEHNLNGFTMEGGRVKVPHAQRALYLAALADKKALPPNSGQALKDAMEKATLFETPVEREGRLKQALEEEISLAITTMNNGIERASVFFDKQVQPGEFGPPLKTASVAAQATGGVPLDDDQIDKICYLCVGAIAGLKPENVTILDGNGKAHVGRPAEQGGPGGDTIYHRMQRSTERDWNTKIRTALSYIPNLTVTSTVELDHDKDSHTFERKNDKPVPVQTIEDTQSTTRGSTSAGGAPGLQAQGGGAMQQVSLNSAGQGSNETSDKTKNEQVNSIGFTTTERETAGLTTKSVKVSVGIPASYYEKVWKEQNPAKEGDEAKKPDQAAIEQIRTQITQDVKTHVAMLLPTTPDVKDPSTLVTVTTFQDLTAAPIPSTPMSQRALNWLGQNWTMAAVLGLVLFTLAMLRSMLRGTSGPAAQAAASPAIAMRVSGSEGKGEAAEEPVEMTAARRLRRITGSGPSLRDELSEFVKEDPDSAANILRSWIGQVS